MEKTHIWLSQYEWKIFTKFLEIWRKNGRQPVPMYLCREMGFTDSLNMLYHCGVVERISESISDWSPNPNVNVGIIRSSGILEADE